MRKVAKISSSLEDYLEAIYEIIEEKRDARAKEVASRLSVAASSVSVALQGLSRRGLIHHLPYNAITLTPTGKKLAEEIAHRHRVLKRFFVEVLEVENSVADDCACKMEHIISDEVLGRFMEFIETKAVKK